MIWVNCFGYADYEISEYGDIRRKENNPRGRWEGGRLKTQWLRNGYKLVKMPRNKSCKVHRLVTLSFHGQPPSEAHTDVAHWDGDKNNNHYKNLRWATRKENVADAMRHGTLDTSGLNRRGTYWMRNHVVG